MSRTTAGKVTKNRHKKIIKLAKGYRGRSKSCFTVAIEKVEKALRYAYRDRKARKRDFRALWIQRINAAARVHDMVYSQFINGLIKANVEIDRKMLAELAVHDASAFAELIKQAKAALVKSA